MQDVEPGAVSQEAIKMPIKESRSVIDEIERKISSHPDAIFGDAFPLKHSFADGLYVRQVSVPKGVLLVSKIHKFSHAAFLLKGEISIFGTEGVRRLKAPMAIITPAGTKRVVYHHEDTIFCTVHATSNTDLAAIEEEIIAKDFDEIDGVFDAEILNTLITQIGDGV